MRFNSVGYLGTNTYTMDRYHNQKAVTNWKKVYCNRFYDNASLQQQAAVNDNRKLAQYEVMSSEYSGEKLFKLDESETAVIYTITLASMKGDRTVLTVECEMGNSE